MTIYLAIVFLGETYILDVTLVTVFLALALIGRATLPRITNRPDQGKGPPA